MQNAKAVSWIVKAATAASLAVAIAIAVSGQAMATPAIAQKTGKACGACHTTPPTLNAAGKKYKDSMGK